MKDVRRQLGIAVVLVSWAAAQALGQVELKSVRAAPEGDRVRVEITLSSPVNPSVETAVQPDRLVVVLPDTVAGGKPERVEVNANSVRAVRSAQYSATPPVTHVVLDLDQTLPYTLASQGNQVIVRVGPAPRVSRNSGAPAAAASGSLIGIFRRRREARPEASNVPAPEPVPPPVSRPPIAFPGEQTADRSSAANSSTEAPPMATHPNYGSLQQGTVFPGLGTPGAGNVPQTTGTDAGYPPVTAATTGSRAGASTPQAALTTPSVATNPATQTALVEKPANVASSQPTTPMPASQRQLNPIVSPQTTVGQAGVTSAQDVARDLPQPSGTPSGAGEASQSDQPVLTLRAAPDLKTVFRVKYVADGVAYLDGGRSSGLAEGMKLEVKDTNLPASQGDIANPGDPRVVAELVITGLAETSAVTDIHEPKREVKPGDLAYLSSADEEALVQQRALSATRKYPAVVTFTEGDPLEEEAREEVPRPPLPSVNRARGRIGFDYLGTRSHDAGELSSADLGLVLRADITRIGGTYWNLSGYWRGRLSSRSSNAQPTLQDLINRTYHLSMTYENPQSAWVAGFGRLYLPWASSLDTIDGGYFGRKLSPGTTTGIFAGSTPDPTSWDYNPDRRIGGAFINFEGGSFDNFHYTSTSGMGVSTLKWQVDRPFVFMEDGLFYKRYLSIYYSMQADSPRGNPGVPAPGPGLARSFLTVRVQPHPRFELDFNHTYFRDIPTFDPQLIGTGLLDKYLFQGFSAGGRVQVIKQVSVYTNLGFSNRTGDTKQSLNQLYGITYARLPWVHLRADAHYSRFNSSFGEGNYRSFSLSRDLGEGLRLEALLGQQRFTSALAGNDSAKFVTGMADWSIGSHYFLQGGMTVNRGNLQNYDQWSISLGYRFDNRSRKGH